MAPWISAMCLANRPQSAVWSLAVGCCSQADIPIKIHAGGAVLTPEPKKFVPKMLSLTKTSLLFWLNVPYEITVYLWHDTTFFVLSPCVFKVFATQPRGKRKTYAENTVLKLLRIEVFKTIHRDREIWIFRLKPNVHIPCTPDWIFSTPVVGVQAFNQF
jgi:hypothetical protein